MTATTTSRNTPRRTGEGHRSYPMAAAASALAGTIAVLDAGNAKMGATATGLVAVGVFSHGVDNSAGGAGDESATVERGIYRFANSAAADEIALDDIGKKAYIVDNQTVALTDGTATRSVAGIIDDVDSAGVWVRIDPTNGLNV